MCIAQAGQDHPRVSTWNDQLYKQTLNLYDECEKDPGPWNPWLYEGAVSSHVIYNADFPSLKTGENYHFYLHLFYNTHRQCTYWALWK